MFGSIGIVLASWLVLGAGADLAQRIKLFKQPLGDSLRRLVSLPRADLGKVIAHAGLGITIFGISAITAWQSEDIRVAKPGETFELHGARLTYQVRFDDVREVQGPNYVATQGEFTVMVNGKEIARLRPEKRIYTVSGQPTTEAAIDIGITRDVYLVIGDKQKDGGWAVRSYIKPFANWIWAGAIIMALGGIFSLSDRRYRIAAGARRRRAAASAVAAE